MEKANLKITYHQEGDYLIPDLVLPSDTNNYQIWIFKIRIFKRA